MGIALTPTGGVGNTHAILQECCTYPMPCFAARVSPSFVVAFACTAAAAVVVQTATCVAT